jgi:hypothetical protein
VIEGLTYWAQALDNSSSDHIVALGEELSPDDSEGRQHAVSQVSDVIRGGTCIFEEDGVRLTADQRHFVLEIPSEQRDQVGRIAPIVCYGHYDRAQNNVLWASVAAGLRDFSRHIGRSLQSEQLGLARASFVMLKKSH